MDSPNEITGEYDPLDEAIAEYVQAAEAGAQPDRTAFIARHPDLADPLRAFFADYDRLGRQAMAFHMPNPDATQSLDGTSSKSNLPMVRYLGDYELLSEIARGGMGVVFKARQVSLNRIVAVKMILAGAYATEEAVQRFRVEAEAAANLDHPNILPIYEVGEHEGHQYFSMKLVAGESLAAKIASLQSQPRAIAGLMATLSRAVNFAHQRGILHRDLKPGNVLIDTDGTPFVTDFGLAKKVDSDDGGTRTGAVVGPPSYMAPEQARGEKGLTTAVDVYSLGAILYELLAGRPAFKNDAVFTTIKQVIESEAADPRTFCPTADQDLSVIALKCLEKDPSRRYATAGELADDLERRLRNEPITARLVTRRERALKWVRRNPAVAGLAAGLLIVTAIAFVGITWGLVRAENSRIALSKSNEDLAKSVEDLGKSNDDLAKAENEARQRASEAEYKGYLSDVNLARQLDRANDLAGMRVALDRCPPPLRKWEWYYLNNLARPKMETIEADALPIAMEYSPDGKLFAFLTSNGILTIRDRTTGASRFRIDVSLQNLASSVVELTFLHESAELAVVAYMLEHNFHNGSQAGNSQVQLIDLKTGSQRRLVVPVDPSRPNKERFDYLAMAYDTAGRLLGAAPQYIQEKDKDGNPIRQFGYLIRDVLAEKTIATLPVYPERAGFHVMANGMAFSPDGTRFAADVCDSGMRESVSFLPAPRPQKGAAANDQNAAAVPDTKFDAATEAAAAAFKPGVTIWDIPTGKMLRQTPYDKGDEKVIRRVDRFRTLRFCPRGEMYQINSRQLDIINFDPKVPIASITGASGNILAVAFQGKERIWTGGEDRLIRAYDAVTHAKLLELRGCPNTIARIAVAPNGNEVTAVTIERLKSKATLCRFDAASLGHDSRQFGGGSGKLVESVLSSDGRRALGLAMSVTDHKCQLTMYDLAAGTEVSRPGPEGFSRHVFLPTGGYACAAKDKIVLFDAAGQPDHEMRLPEHDGDQEMPPVLTVTADGGTLLGWMVPKMSNQASENELKLVSWNLKTRQLGKILTTHPKGTNPELQKIERLIALPWCCAVHPNGRWIATGSVLMMVKDGSVQFHGLLIVWDLEAGKEIYRRVTDEPLRAVAWDQHDRIVAAGGTELGGTVHAFDFTTGTEAYSLRGHSGPILGLALSPDGRLATAGADRVVKVWDIATGRELLTLDGFAQAVTNVAFTPDGADLVAATGIDILPLLFEIHAPGEKPNDWPPGEVRIFHGSTGKFHPGDTLTDR